MKLIPNRYVPGAEWLFKCIRSESWEHEEVESMWWDLFVSTWRIISLEIAYSYHVRVPQHAWYEWELTGQENVRKED